MLRFNKDMGDKIREARVAARMTQTQLAQKVGITPSCVSQYECGRRMPCAMTLVLMAEALDVSVVQLIPEISHETVADENQTNIFDEGGLDG